MRAVCVVGGGPAGLHLAYCVQREGFDAVVLEEHPEIGKPSQCAGLVSKSGIDELGLELGSAVVNEVRGARLFSPGGEKLTVWRKSAVAYVIDRAAFDSLLHKRAVRSGAEVLENTQALDINEQTIFTKHSGRGEMVKAPIIAGADGPLSKIRGMLGINVAMGNFVHSYQARVEGSYDREFVELHFGKFAPGFFAWVIPESSSVARIGVGAVGRNPKECFEEFVSKQGFDGGRNSELSALIPVGPPLPEPCGKNMLLVGDAAFHTKATSGGGIVMGMNAAKVCAETIVQHYKNKRPLSEYSKNLGAINKELATHWKVRAMLNSLDAEGVDRLFAKLRKAGIEEFLNKEGDMDRPSRFWGKLLLKPKVWWLLPELVGLLRR